MDSVVEDAEDRYFSALHFDQREIVDDLRSMEVYHSAIVRYQRAHRHGRFAALTADAPPAPAPAVDAPPAVSDGAAAPAVSDPPNAYANEE